MSKAQGANKEKLSVAIVGARGYSGLELARILLRHPAFQLAAVSANSPFELYDEVVEPAAREVPFVPLEQLLQLSSIHAVFLATPAETSLELAPKFLARGAHVIDLSGAFRLKRGGPAAYKKWYGMQHEREDLLAMAEYGLRPWSTASSATQEHKGPRLISNPGCYATACLMALIPLIRLGLLEPSQIVIDAKSGTTGGGRKASEDLLFSEVADDCRPYKVGSHQHTPEIVEGLEAFAGPFNDGTSKFAPAFTTHLLPVRRGIIASIYAGFSASHSGQTDNELECAVAGAFAEFYSGYPLVRVGRIGEKATKQLLSLRSVTGTPYTNLAYTVKDGRLYLFSLLDNLLKGAASQAVENLNIINQLPVETGLCSTSALMANLEAL